MTIRGICFFHSSVVTYRRKNFEDDVVAYAAQPNELPEPPVDDDKVSSIRTRTRFPETWLWENLLVNGYFQNIPKPLLPLDINISLAPLKKS